MIKLNKKVTFILFAICLFIIGYEIYYLIENGFGTTNDLIFRLLLILSLIISSYYFGRLLYAKKHNIK